MNEQTGENNAEYEDDDELEDDDFDVEDEEWDEYEYMKDITPVGKINEFVFLRNALQEIARSNPNYYEELLKHLTPEAKLKLEEIFKSVEK
jgi:hypothetical protein